MSPPAVPALLSPEDVDRLVAMEQTIEVVRHLVQDWPTLNIVEASARVEELRKYLDVIPNWKSRA